MFIGSTAHRTRKALAKAAGRATQVFPCSVAKACYLKAMQITVELPEAIARHPDPGREALQALAIEGYRSHKLTQFAVGQMLDLSRIQTEDFLALHVDLYEYSTQELEAEADLLHRRAALGL